MHIRTRSSRLFGAMIIAMALLTSSLEAREPLDRIVAVVNEDVILASELEAELQRVVRSLKGQVDSLPPRQVLQQQVLERLIVQRIQLSLADRAGIQVDEATLNAAVRRVAEQNRMGLSEFRDALRQEGYDYGQFREQLRKEIKMQRVRQRSVESQVRVNPHEIDEYLAAQSDGADAPEYLLGHILIAVSEGADDDETEAARRKAEEVRQQLRQGADFATMAATHSDAGTALDGGKLGWRSQGQLPTLFAPVVPGLKVGQVSDVIATRGGFHLVKLLDRRSSNPEMATETRARHILLRTDALVSDTDARARLQSLRQRIINGADFADLARAHSADRASAAKGGDLGWSMPGSFVPEFEQAMSQLEPGQISMPFQSQYGWHIVQVLERRQRDVSEDARRQRAAQVLHERKMEEAVESWIRRLRDEAYVDIRLES